MRLALATAATLLLAAAAPAQVAVTDPVLKPKAGDASQAYVLGTILAPAGDSLVGVASPAAKGGHVHLTRRGRLGEMRALHDIPLPAGRPRALTVYGYHAMLTGVTPPLKPGLTVPVTFRFRTAAPVTVRATVAAR